MAREGATRKSGGKEFVFSVAILCTILIGRFYAKSFLTFYVLFEAALLPTAFIILSWGYQPERIQATKYLILYTVCARLPLLVAIIWLNKVNGVVSFVGEA